MLLLLPPKAPLIPGGPYGPGGLTRLYDPAEEERDRERERDSVPQASKASKREGEIYRRNLARRKATQSLVQIVMFHLLAMGLCGLLHHWKRMHSI